MQKRTRALLLRRRASSEVLQWVYVAGAIAEVHQSYCTVVSTDINLHGNMYRKVEVLQVGLLFTLLA